MRTNLLIQFQFQFSLFANKGSHKWTEQFEEYKHNETYVGPLQGTANTSNYSVMCVGDAMTHHDG